MLLGHLPGGGGGGVGLLECVQAGFGLWFVTTVAPVSHEQCVPHLLPWLQTAVSAEVGDEFGEDLENGKRHPDTRVTGGWSKPWALASVGKGH